MDFDKELSRRLQQAREEAAPQAPQEHWELLAERLAENAEVDAKLTGKLKKAPHLHQPAYNKAHWMLLREQLPGYSPSRLVQLWQSPVARAAAVLLALGSLSLLALDGVQGPNNPTKTELADNTPEQVTTGTQGEEPAVGADQATSGALALSGADAAANAESSPQQGQATASMAAGQPAPENVPSASSQERRAPAASAAQPEPAVVAAAAVQQPDPAGPSAAQAEQDPQHLPQNAPGLVAEQQTDETEGVESPTPAASPSSLVAQTEPAEVAPETGPADTPTAEAGATGFSTKGADDAAAGPLADAPTTETERAPAGEDSPAEEDAFDGDGYTEQLRQQWLAKNAETENQEAAVDLEMGFVMGTLANISEGSNNQGLNMTAGMVSSIPLARRLRLQSGVMLTRQTFGMNQADQPTRTAMAVEGNQSSRQPTSLDVAVLSLDIPLNLTYAVAQGRSRGVDVGVGVSSMAYLQEQSTLNYTQEETRMVEVTDQNGILLRTQPETFTVTGQELRVDDSFTGFDLAPLLNLSVAVHQHFSSGSLALEPYLKYPIAPVTSQNLQVGQAGVNLRYSFLGR